MTTDTRQAFVESGEEEPRTRTRNLRLPINDDGSIDWETATDKHKKAFIEAIKSDPSGILQNIQEEAEGAVAGPMVADATVVALANVFFIAEGLVFSTVGRKVVPQFQHLHPVVAIKACCVTQEEMEPVMEPAKRLVARYMPPQFLEYQDIAVVGEHLLKLSTEKFKACLELAMQIEQMKASALGTPERANGHAQNVVVGQ